MTRRDDDLLPGTVPGDHASETVLRELSGSFDGSESRIVIAADDLPDAVSLDDESMNGRFVIEDDSLAGPVRPASGLDPRIRARRIAVRRAEGRRRLRWVVVVGGAVAAVVAVLAVLGSPLVAIDRVDVEGAVYTDPDLLRSVVDELQGTPILTADLSVAEERLETDPWVREARVTMDFPDRVLVEVAERRPLASFRGTDGLFRVIDIDGHVLAVIPGRPVDYVEITGEGPDLEAGAVSGEAHRGAARLANALPPAVRQRLTSIGVTPTGELTLLLDARPGGVPVEVLFGPPDDYQEKLVALTNELARQTPGSVSRIDVSTGSPIIS